MIRKPVTSMRVYIFRLLSVVCFTFATAAAPAQNAPAPKYHGPKYVRSEAMIPVRDGVELHTVILRPEGSDAGGPPLPFLMQRTPYGVAGASAESVTMTKPELAASGYI